MELPGERSCALQGAACASAGSWATAAAVAGGEPPSLSSFPSHPRVF